MGSYFRTTVLLTALTAFFIGIGYLVGGMAGAVIALVVAGGMNAFAYWNSDKMVLRMHGAKQVDARSAPELHGIVQDLVQRAGMPMPKVYVMDNPQPNAFATGRNPQNAAVAATTGLMQLCNKEEVAGVMAHELAHVRNRDTLIMTITATIAGAISMIGSMGMFMGRRRGGGGNAILGLLVMILAPIAAALVQMAISRTREYAADRGGAEISGQPLWLASALQKLAQGAAHIPNRAAEANPATAHVFIINPLHVNKMDGLFTTHPKAENRVAKLVELAENMGQSSGHAPSYDQAFGGGSGRSSRYDRGQGGFWDKPGGGNDFDDDFGSGSGHGSGNDRGPWG